MTCQSQALFRNFSRNVTVFEILRFLAVFWPFLDHFWPKVCKMGFLAQKWPKSGRKSQNLKNQKKGFVCILKCHYHAKKGLQWVNLTRVLLFRSKFSDP